jgi:hypothetical protein
MRFPSIKDVSAELRAEYATVEWAMLAKDNDESLDECYLDVRLQVYESGSWAIRSGDPCYDTDHHGYWGASCIAQCDTPKTLRETAKDLINQARDMKAQGE